MSKKINVADLPDFDMAEQLRSEEDIAAYLTMVIEDGDAALLAAALGDVARARGMAQVAKDSGVTREALYKALRPGAQPPRPLASRSPPAPGALSPTPPARAPVQAQRRRLSPPAPLFFCPCSPLLLPSRHPRDDMIPMSGSMTEKRMSPTIKLIKITRAGSTRLSLRQIPIAPRPPTTLAPAAAPVEASMARFRLRQSGQTRLAQR